MISLATVISYAGQIVAMLFGLSIVLLLLSIVSSIHKGKLDINKLISEPDGKASISRFQLFLFTFVIAGLYALLSIEAGRFVEIPDSVLGLLGISGGGFLLSKGIGKKPDDQAAQVGAQPNQPNQPVPTTTPNPT
jgi:hypothetical protein